MFERWKLKDFAPGEGFSRGAAGEQYDTSEWIDISAPGDVHQALIDAGRIKDPFYDRNELECTWVEDREWWYRLQFEGPIEGLQADERWQLVFHGLDTFVTIWLNGEVLGKHGNMFREATFDVSKLLRPGQPNTLVLCFDRPLDHVLETSMEFGGHVSERETLRKAQFGYGWDWGPRLPTVGIWRPVELRRQRKAALTGVHFATLELEPDYSQALVSVNVEVGRFATDAPLEAVVTLLSSNSSTKVASQTLKLTKDAAKAYIQVEKPNLWWTHDLGDPYLYQLQVVLRQNGEELAREQQQVGIRTIELDQTPDAEERGTRFFRFVLNGVPIFARGADWIPAHSFVGAITDQHYEMLLRTAYDAHMNMLRVWGGGIYEHDVFYRLCNQLGILVWQDFMFACAPYPEDNAEFVQEVEAEARYQVRRLRSEPCMALWCGNNENQWNHDQRYWDRPDYPVPGALYYSTILPQVVKELDGKTPYWPGSPYGGNDYNGQSDGDVHNWQTWHGSVPRKFGEQLCIDQSPEGVSFLHYGEDMGRFISEFGMHASPVFETLRRNIPADQLYHHSSSMDHHNKDNPKNKGDNLMQGVTGLPKDLAEYIDFSMIAQAEGLKFGIEHYRRRKPHCSGTLFWQLNDCWPVLSWSVVDYYGVGKAGYYYAKRVYSPILASFKALLDGSYELWLTNDTLSDIDENVTVRLGNFADGVIWEEQIQAHVPANGSHAVYRWSAERVAAQADRYLTVSSAHDLFPANRHFFTPIKDLQRTAVAPEVSIEAHGEHELHVYLRADAYVYFLHLDVADEHTRFSDNYFDLSGGEQRTIVVSNPVKSLTPDMVSLGWR